MSVVLSFQSLTLSTLWDRSEREHDSTAVKTQLDRMTLREDSIWLGCFEARKSLGRKQASSKRPSLREGTSHDRNNFHLPCLFDRPLQWQGLEENKARQPLPSMPLFLKIWSLGCPRHFEELLAHDLSTRVLGALESKLCSKQIKLAKYRELTVLPLWYCTDLHLRPERIVRVL